MDAAVLRFGLWVDRELEERDKWGRSKRGLEELLGARPSPPDPLSHPSGTRAGEGGESSSHDPRFRNPMSVGPVRTVRPNADGTW